MRKTRRTRLAKGSRGTKEDYLEIRLGASEKRAFRDAAELAGLALSAWVRERLRVVARDELERAGKLVPLLQAYTAT